ncbi:protein of unknown function [Flavobacterium psychrophilum]|nr:protein of unknown function [Flavobacterium psychrophilum]
MYFKICQTTLQYCLSISKYEI